MRLHNQAPITLSLKESILMIFIEAAHQDNVFSPEEKEYILARFEKTSFDKVLMIYESLTEGKRVQLILDLLENLNIVGEDFKKLKYDLLVLFHADGNFCQFEQEFLTFLEEVSQAICTNSAIA